MRTKCTRCIYVSFAIKGVYFVYCIIVEIRSESNKHIVLLDLPTITTWRREHANQWADSEQHASVADRESRGQSQGTQGTPCEEH